MSCARAGRTVRRASRSWAETADLARWPLLLLIGLAIIVEVIAYILVRQLVNVLEWAWQFRGQRGKLRSLMREARTYDEWRDAALKMDERACRRLARQP